jgi:2-haloacid dehalogenase
MESTTQKKGEQSMAVADEVKALVFDVFGTVVDWRSSVAREGEKLAEAKGITHVDWAKFADTWRSKYGPSMNKVRQGEMPWTRLDDLHRMSLDECLEEYNVPGLTEDEKADFNLAWHRLDPWPDSPPGLTRLKKKYIIATLSNGNVALLTNMAKFGGLPWDCILSAELAKHYKPDPETYRTAAYLLGLRTDQVMMVAAHQGDLLAAQKVGLRSAFVPRPLERGPDNPPDPTPDPSFDYVAKDFVELAEKLGT